jgi:hypothetical protein
VVCRCIEIANHLGNTLATISDRKTATGASGTPVTFFQPITQTANDYYPFGMIMPGRNYTTPASGNKPYKYGFNGQERSLEIDPNGNSNMAEFWQYDARLGRRWNVDPVVKIWESPYACLSNNPIWLSDPDGDDANNGGGPGKKKTAETSNARQNAITVAIMRIANEVLQKRLAEGKPIIAYDKKTAAEIGKELGKALDAYAKKHLTAGEREDNREYLSGYYLGLARVRTWSGKFMSAVAQWVITGNTHPTWTDHRKIELVNSYIQAAEKTLCVFTLFQDGVMPILTWGQNVPGINQAGAGYGLRAPAGSGTGAVKTTMQQMATMAANKAAKGGFNATSFADEIVTLNKATDGGGILLNGTPSSAINSAMYYETAALQFPCKILR